MVGKEDVAVSKFKRDNLVANIKTLYQKSLEVVVADADTTDFDVRFAKLENHYESFGTIQARILNAIVLEDPKADLTEEHNLVKEVDNYYFAILATHKRVHPIQKHTDLLKNDQVQIVPSVKLPKINLPFFDGQIKDWPHFKDLYISLVHDNNSLQPIEKYQYLLSC